jgi:hypothetical protein
MEMDTSEDTAVGKLCARHGGIWGCGGKNPLLFNVGTEWDECLPSLLGCLNSGERVLVTHQTGSWDSLTTDLKFRQKKKSLPYVGNRTRDLPAHNGYDILAHHHTSSIGSWPHLTSSVQRVYFFGGQASSDEVQNAWGYNSVPSHAFMAWTGTTLPSVYYRSTIE